MGISCAFEPKALYYELLQPVEDQTSAEPAALLSDTLRSVSWERKLFVKRSMAALTEQWIFCVQKLLEKDQASLDRMKQKVATLGARLVELQIRSQVAVGFLIWQRKEVLSEPDYFSSRECAAAVELLAEGISQTLRDIKQK
jgi:hypothetical protein